MHTFSSSLLLLLLLSAKVYTPPTLLTRGSNSPPLTWSTFLMEMDFRFMSWIYTKCCIRYFFFFTKMSVNKIIMTLRLWKLDFVSYQTETMETFHWKGQSPHTEVPSQVIQMGSNRFPCIVENELLVNPVYILDHIVLALVLVFVLQMILVSTLSV